jgi:hypothetical protein
MGVIGQRVLCIEAGAYRIPEVLLLAGIDSVDGRTLFINSAGEVRSVRLGQQ